MPGDEEFEGRVHIDPHLQTGMTHAGTVDEAGFIEGPTFRKAGAIRVKQMHVPFVVKTVRGWAEGEPGDYVAQSCENPLDIWPLAEEIFVATYTPTSEIIEHEKVGG